MTHVDSVVLCVRSWFDKTYGNSYFTMRIVVNGNYAIVSGQMRYGHSWGMYWDAAKELMAGHDFVVDETTASKVIVDECYVHRKKDLHNGGRKNG